MCAKNNSLPSVTSVSNFNYLWLSQFSHAKQTRINWLQFVALETFLKIYTNKVEQLSSYSEASRIWMLLLAKTVRVIAHHVLPEDVERIQNKAYTVATLRHQEKCNDLNELTFSKSKKAKEKFKLRTVRFWVFSFVRRQWALTRMPACLCIVKQLSGCDGSS